MMIVAGVLMVLTAAAAGTVLVVVGRGIALQMHFGLVTWTTDAGTLVILGALSIAWLLLGAAFVRCALSWRRADRTETSQPRPAAGPPSAAQRAADPLG